MLVQSNIVAISLDEYISAEGMKCFLFLCRLRWQELGFLVLSYKESRSMWAENLSIIRLPITVCTKKP